MEADRLRDLGPLMTLEKLNAQREVVRNERRQTSENTPYGKVELRLPELMYPADHPYHHPVIGSHTDLEAATVDDVKGFFAKYYDPANASLVVAGDFEPARMKAKLESWFASIPSRGTPSDPGAPKERRA
jgi:predicted Zn-dependent peptidase